jgi:hypothetical protein
MEEAALSGLRSNKPNHILCYELRGLFCVHRCIVSIGNQENGILAMHNE